MASPVPEEFMRIITSHVQDLDHAAPLTPVSNLDDYGLDSLAAMHLLLTLEQIYGIHIDEEQITEESFRTPSSLWDLIGQGRSTSPVNKESVAADDE